MIGVVVMKSGCSESVAMDIIRVYVIMFTSILFTTDKLKHWNQSQNSQRFRSFQFQDSGSRLKIKKIKNLKDQAEGLREIYFMQT